MKETIFDDLIPRRHPAAARKHRREVFWQITLPLILVLVVMLTAAGLTAGSAWTGAPPALWRDLALIWILLLSMVFALVPMAVLFGLAYGIFRLIGVLPGWTFKIQRFAARVAETAAGISRVVTTPLIRVNAFSSGLRQLFRRGPKSPPHKLRIGS